MKLKSSTSILYFLLTLSNALVNLHSLGLFFINSKSENLLSKKKEIYDYLVIRNYSLSKIIYAVVSGATCDVV